MAISTFCWRDRSWRVGLEFAPARIARLRRTHAIGRAKVAHEMTEVGYANGIRDFLDGEVRRTDEASCVLEAQTLDESLGRLAGERQARSSKVTLRDTGTFAEVAGTPRALQLG